MRSQSRRRRAVLRAIGAGATVLLSIGPSGCAWWEDLEPGENIADKYGEWAGFCGFLQNCGGNGNGNRGGGQTAVGTSSDGSSGDGGTGDGGESAAGIGAL